LRTTGKELMRDGCSVRQKGRRICQGRENDGRVEGATFIAPLDLAATNALIWNWLELMTRAKQTGSDTPSILGDVVVDSVTLNAKGGSTTAIIKRKIVGRLRPSERCYGAKIEFRPGVTCLLMADRKQRFRVTRISGGFLVAVEGNDEVVDPTTKAVLDLYEEMLKASKVKLLSPDEAERRLDRVLEKSAEGGSGGAGPRKDRPAPR
jgi:hypothetical protein